ncbi:MAG: GerW family sporulation protein [Eubacteriales bacterium]|nr:GerW family sporulation protein [Eubacteriales bacterium]
MDRKPIEGVMLTAMESIREMIDVSTVIGEPVMVKEGSTVIPVSRVSFGFAAGGADCPAQKQTEEISPFAGGAGAGVSVQPVGFLVLEQDRVRLLPAQYAAPIDRLIELAPQLLEDCRRYLREKNATSADDASAMAETAGDEA